MRSKIVIQKLLHGTGILNEFVRNVNAVEEEGVEIF